MSIGNALSPPQRQVEMAARQLDSAASGVGLEPVFQPIVSLQDEAVIGFEALARWPRLDNPDPRSVLAHAAATGRAAQLDQMCIETAIERALAAGVGRSSMIFINCEPETPYVRRADNATLARGHDGLQLIFEITERSLLTHPHALLNKVAALRSDGFAIALDDVGAQPDSLALLDVLSPDVIKLDLNLVQSHPRYDQARTLGAVLAHRQRTGAVICAEGIETVGHLQQALAVGASLGQGYRFGRPGPLDLDLHPAVPWSPPPARTSVPWREDTTPFDVVAPSAAVHTERKDTVLALSRYIEGQARHGTDPAMVLTALQRAEHFSGETRRRYHDLAATSPLVAVFGQGLDHELGAGIRGVRLDPADPLCAQWIVLTLGPNTAAALIARDHGNTLEHDRHAGDRLFDVAITNDRSLVTVVARNLLDRML